MPVQQLTRAWKFNQQSADRCPVGLGGNVEEQGLRHGEGHRLVDREDDVGDPHVLGAAAEQVAAAQRLNIPGVRLGDLMETLAAAPDASLDAVVLFDLFHYFPPEQQAAIADAVQRVLKPGGRWIVHVPNGEALFGARMRYWDYLAGGAFTRASIAQLLRTCGFADVRCYEDRPIPHGAKSAVRWVVWMGVRAALRLALAAETGETGREAIFSQCLLAVAIK